MSSFKELSLIEPLLHAVEASGYTQPTPIQKQAIPIVLSRKDLLACAQTGTGKTAAFALPMLQILDAERRPAPVPGRPHPIRALILTPTRELASQISESFNLYGRGLHIKNTVIFGGVSQNPQITAIRRGTDIVIATPGRLLDLIQQRQIRLDAIQLFVLDEADRMLDMGFIHDVRKIIQVIPKQRQTLFFSATMPPEIAKLSRDILNQPMKVEVTPVATTAEKVDQSLYHVEKGKKTSLLIQLLADPSTTRSLVFTRTKWEANRVTDSLLAAGIGAVAIHGNKSQGAREKALASIKSGHARVLVATDIAARGIDIDEVTHVFNLDIPNIPESYVHRIGRTARAGLSGHAVSMCAPDERAFLRDIERLIRMPIRVLQTPTGLVAPPRPPSRPPQQNGFGGGRRQPSGGGRPSSGGRPPRSGGRPSFSSRAPSDGDTRSQGRGSQSSRGPRPVGQPRF